MAKTQSPKKNRTFKVVKGQVGPWSAGAGHSFSEEQFRALHPIPKGADDIDPDTYHDALINRLLAANAIAHAPDETPGEIPPGPESVPGKPVRNPAIEAAVEDIIQNAPPPLNPSPKSEGSPVTA